jgi:GWxTD domain-containing protein
MKIRQSKTLALLILALTGFHSRVFTQSEPGIEREETLSESISCDPLAFAGNRSGLARLDVYVRVGYDALTFVKEGERYEASFEITIGINDSSGSHVTEKSWTEHAHAATFDQSVSSSSSDLVRCSFDLQPARYNLSLLIRDRESKTESRAAFSVFVPDFSLGQIAMSDIMLVNRVTVNGQTKTIIPNVSPNVGDLSDGFYTFSEIYNRLNVDSVRFVTDVTSKTGSVLFQSDTLMQLRPERNEIFVRVAQLNLPLGDYFLVQSVFPVHATGPGRDSVLTRRSHPLVIRWKGIPRSLKDLDQAIEEVQYIAKGGELDSLKSASTLEEKQKLFFEFWKKRDPNPNTPRNEKMIEYYARVEYANKHFTHYRPGWKTDMGMVYIVLGPPGSIDRHPFEIDSKPYEVWSYYDLNYQFVFVDESGYGDYRLITPFWEIYNRRHD